MQLRRPKKLAGAGQAEAARYLVQITLELEQLANTSGLEMVGYFLAMARAEAASVGASRPVAEPPLTPPQAPYLTE